MHEVEMNEGRSHRGILGCGEGEVKRKKGSNRDSKDTASSIPRSVHCSVRALTSSAAEIGGRRRLMQAKQRADAGWSGAARPRVTMQRYLSTVDGSSHGSSSGYSRLRGEINVVHACDR